MYHHNEEKKITVFLVKKMDIKCMKFSLRFRRNNPIIQTYIFSLVFFLSVFFLRKNADFVCNRCSKKTRRGKNMNLQFNENEKVILESSRYVARKYFFVFFRTTDEEDKGERIGKSLKVKGRWRKGGKGVDDNHDVMLKMLSFLL